MDIASTRASSNIKENVGALGQKSFGLGKIRVHGGSKEGAPDQHENHKDDDTTAIDYRTVRDRYRQNLAEKEAHQTHPDPGQEGQNDQAEGEGGMGEQAQKANRRQA